MLCSNSSNQLSEVIPRKKLLPFGHCPKVALTPPPRFGHLWGNFCLSRLRKNIPPKIPQNNLKSTLKIPKNYPKTFGMGSTPPLLLKMSKRKPKKTTPKLLESGWTPPPFWKMSKRMQLFSRDYFPY